MSSGSRCRRRSFSAIFELAFGGCPHQDIRHCLDRIGEWYVLPQPDDTPPSRLKSFVGGPVALDVPAQLRSPVPLVAGRLPTVFRADMPEAAVNEDRDLARSEHDVRTDTNAFGEIEPEVLAVPVALSVERAAQGDLGFGVGPAVRPHVPRSSLAGRPWIGPPGRATFLLLRNFFLSHTAPSANQVPHGRISGTSLMRMRRQDTARHSATVQPEGDLRA